MGLQLDAAHLNAGAESPAPDEGELERAYTLETARLVRVRLDLSIAFFTAFMGIVVLFERRLPGHATVVDAYAIEVLICLAALVLTRIPRFRVATTVIAALATAGLALTMVGYSAYVHSPLDPVAIGQICLMTCVSVVLPWGWRAQFVLAATSLTGFVLALPLLETSTPVLYGLVAVLTSATTSCVAAFFLDRYRFQAFARAVELSRAYAQQQEEAEISTALLHVGEMLSQFVGRAELLDQVNRLVIDAIGCDWSSTFVYDEEQNAFRFVANVGSRTEIRTELETLDLLPDSMPVFAELQAGRLVEIADASLQSMVPMEMLVRWEVASMLCAPIYRNEQLIGVIGTGYVERRGPFSRKQRRLLMGISHAVSVGVDNERLIRDLRAANRLKSDFVATMSHELRTPLNVILGYAEMLGDAAPSPADVDHIARRVRRSAEELLELVNATLDLGRMESGRDVLNVERISLGQLLAEVESELEALARTRNLLVSWNDRTDGLPILSDRVKLKTILKNLVGNAIKYTNQGSVTVSAEQTRDAIVLIVTDTGIGIEKADLAAIFEMFRQVDGSATSSAGGVGLGLYIVRQLVDRLGGTIAVESTPRVGSTFTVRLPKHLDFARATGRAMRSEHPRMSS